MVAEIESHRFQAQWYLNGFPKSGLHALVLAIRAIAQPMVEDGLWERAWAGTFNDNSWTLNAVPAERVLYRIHRLSDGHYLKAHARYGVDIERFLWYAGISHVFIYRDLRDVAVSQSYHVVAEDDRFQHPDKELYRSLPDHEEVLKAVITGLDRFAGLFERWELYAPWLDVPWVYKVRYEDLRLHPRKVMADILKYGLERVAPLFGCKLNVNEDAFRMLSDFMAASIDKTERSATFRKGTAGQWREEFTPGVKALFKEYDRDNWLVRLGYEKEADW